MDNDIKKLKTDLAILKKEKVRLEAYLKKITSAQSDTNTLTDQQISRLGPVIDKLLSSLSSISVSPIEHGTGDLAISQAIQSQLRTIQVNFNSGVKEVTKLNTRIETKLRSLKS
jgi:hypothetical protein